ncbi:hypothetical protein [Streptomyces shenzhenensis]|uniref:Helix-turn-helix domain-containing protein n=1 Tax=Streptomyces shenzhenensis TaxID=943815 RepID=A0A3M0IFN9_9ACTN|nr:hypothetical protein [Streptomyces shenzhenensis]RMB85603.1 hypothetical protein CTZ28_12485 [Streptomyces shenzhenensis]
MSTDEQDARTPGSVPNAFGNALAWRWARSMPRALKPGLLTLLYALRAMSNAAGELRFSDGKPIRIQDIAKAAGADEKDARDRLEAAVRAGVVVVRGERRRGRTALYAIVLAPVPNWPAAVAYLEGVKASREEARQKREAERKAAPWAEENGGRSPELEGSENGGPTPELTDGTAEEERGTAPRMSSGDRPLNGSGDRPPNTPGGYPWGSQDGAEVSFKPQVVGRSGDQDESHEPNPDDHTTWRICPGCNRRIMPDPQRPDRTMHARCEPATHHERHSA